MTACDEKIKKKMNFTEEQKIVLTHKSVLHHNDPDKAVDRI